MSTPPAVAADARSRAWRTFLQGVAFSLASALIVTLLTALGTATSWSELGGILVGFAFFQSVATAVLAYVMRTWLDGRVTEPPNDAGRVSLVVALLVAILVGVVLLFLGFGVNLNVK